MPFSAAEALAAYGLGQQASMRREAQARTREEWQRKDESRAALSEYVLSRPAKSSPHSFMSAVGAHHPAPGAAGLAAVGQPAVQPMGGPSTASALADVGRRALSPRDEAYERLARADPEAALKARQTEFDLSNDEIKVWSSVNEAGLSILGSVYDQSSYDIAKARGRQLYERFGLDTSWLDTLPAEYAPDVVNQARMETMEAKDQLAALRADRQLDWNIEDDLLDNEREDRNVESQIATRGGHLANARRGQDMADARGRRGQDIASDDRQRGQDIGSSDRRRGQDIGSRDRRDSAAFRGRRGRAGAAARIVNPTTGEAMVLSNGQWVRER
jgi:hypothetical protein